MFHILENSNEAHEDKGFLIALEIYNTDNENYI